MSEPERELSFDELVADRLAAGFEIAQQGAIAAPGAPGLSFASRALGFDWTMLGAHRPPTWQSEFENLLLDETEHGGGERWVHLRRRR